MSTRLPASGRLRPARAAPRRPPTISSGSAMRPTPASPRSAISPALGPTSATPSAASWARLRRVAALRPHARVHRRREQHRLVGREQHRGGEIVGVAARHLGHQVGGRGRDDDQVGVARQADVADVELARRVEQVGEDALAGERAAASGVTNCCAAAVMTHAHARAALAQPADQVERLVGRDAAADDEQDAPGCAAASARPRAAPPAGWADRSGRAPRARRPRRPAQDDADLVLHRAAVPRRAHAQQLLELLVELADRQTGHGTCSPH